MGSRQEVRVSERKVELWRFVRIKSMTQIDQPLSVIVGGVDVDYFRCWLAERTSSFISVRKTRSTIEHHPPSNPLRMDMDAISLSEVAERPWTYRFLYTFCKERKELFSMSQREIIELYFGEGYTERQIAFHLGISKTAARRKVENVRKRVTRIARYGGAHDATRRETEEVHM